MQQQPDNSTVAQEAVAAAGVPQGGIADMARALAPKTDMTQNTGAMPVQGMYGGGYVQKMQSGGLVALQRNPAALAFAQKEAQRLGMSLEQYVAQMPQQESDSYSRFLETQANRNRMLGFEPVGDGAAFPTQSDLDARYSSSLAEEPRFAPDQAPPPQPMAMEYGRPIYETLAGRTGTLLPEDLGTLRGQRMTPEERAVAERRGQIYSGISETAGEIFDATKEFSDDYIFGPVAGAAATGAGAVSDVAGTAATLIPGLEGFAISAGEAGDAARARASQFFDEGVFPDQSAYEEQNPIIRDALRRREQEASTAEDPMYAAAKRSAEDAAAARDAAGITESLGTPEQVAAAAAAARKAQVDGREGKVPPVASDVVSGGTRTSGGAGSASGATSYEQELINAMQRAERRAEQDKWLALAQVGLGLMSSTQPTIGGALGEAGLAGLQSYQGARDEYETERLGLSKELAGIEAARAAQQAAAAKARSGPTLQQTLNSINEELSNLTIESEDLANMGQKTLTAAYPQDQARVNQLVDTRGRIIDQLYAPSMTQ
jgi:hypothetical protein